MGDKARFSLGKGRDDLAEAALSRQLDLEAELARLDRIQADAAKQALRLDECTAALAARKTQMEAELAAFEAARADTMLGGDGPTRRDQALQRKVDRAQETFDRVMAGAGGKPAAARRRPGGRDRRAAPERGRRRAHGRASRRAGA